MMPSVDPHRSQLEKHDGGHQACSSHLSDHHIHTFSSPDELATMHRTSNMQSQVVTRDTGSVG